MNCGFLLTGKKEDCFGCEACVQVCPRKAITMREDDEGFRYPIISQKDCIQCKLCERVCPTTNINACANKPIKTYGGYSLDAKLKEESTSGGFYSAIVNAWADEDTFIFGAEANGLMVNHGWIKGLAELKRFRKSKYSQSNMHRVYCDVKQFLSEGNRVCFSGTPCHIAALKNFLGTLPQDNLLTIEVVCEGVPSPFYIKKFTDWLCKKHCGDLLSLDYRYKDGRKWDFEVMQVQLQKDSKKVVKFKKDRWFNPFWSIWLQHLMSRPSCYICPFAKQARYADITLGDLWGVHLYCPDLYGRNGGASVAFCNTMKGVEAFTLARETLYSRELKFEDALRYQGPLRNHISMNSRRDGFMEDLRRLEYEDLIKKWVKPITFRLWFSKYIWGNRQKVWLWNLIHKVKSYKTTRYQ